MIGASSLPVEALRTVGLVLVEAMILYVGYGVLTSALEPRLTEALRNR
ncbi:MAG: hypothetical protein V5A43_03370 [Haloarculaceae archaeon]